MRSLIGNSPEARRTITNSIVRSFFPTYTSSSDDMFPIIEEHIHTHGYFLQKEYNVAISESEYFTSWTEYVLEPILSQLNRLRNTNFIDPLEEYVKVSTIWFNMSRTRSLHGFENLQKAFNQYVKEG